ncbi:MAG: TorF family putative porin [Pseudomonadota bacterium]
MTKTLSMAAIALLTLASAQQSLAADLDTAPVVEEVEEKSSLLPGEISGSVGLYSDYRFRGISQTDRGPSVQGTIDYSIGSPVEGIDIYLGAFGANINFTPVAPIEDGSVEFDFYGGLAGTFNDVNWAVGAIYFFYPDASSTLDQDYVEATLAFDYDVFDGFNVGLNYNVSPDFFGGIGVAHWIQGTASYSIPLFEALPLTLDGSVGYQEFEGTGDYVTWHVGLTAEIHKHLDIGVQYIDTNTNIPGDEVSNISGATALGFISAKF